MQADARTVRITQSLGLGVVVEHAVTNSLTVTETDFSALGRLFSREGQTYVMLHPLSGPAAMHWYRQQGMACVQRVAFFGATAPPQVLGFEARTRARRSRTRSRRRTSPHAGLRTAVGALPCSSRGPWSSRWRCSMATWCGTWARPASG